MISFYTPKEWFSMFPVEQMQIDDDGYIYDGYKKLGSIPIGKVDWETGLIYDKDQYNKLMKIPMGKIEEKDGVMFVYGSDYNRPFRTPLLYIKGGSVYDYDQFHKLFPIETGYIKDDRNKETQESQIDTKTYEKPSGTDLSWMAWVGIILAVLFAIGSLVESIPLFTGKLDIEYGELYTKWAWISVLLGTIIAVIGTYISAALGKRESLKNTICTTAVSMAIPFICASVGIDSKYGSSYHVALDIVLGIFDVFTFLIPAIIVGFIIFKVRQMSKSDSSDRTFDLEKYINKKIIIVLAGIALIVSLIVYFSTKEWYLTKSVNYSCGDVTLWSEYEYDANGNMIKETRYRADGSVYAWYENEYDANGKATGSISYNENGSAKGYSEYEYDANGNETKYTQYNADGSVFEWIEYEYDANGNETKQTIYASYFSGLIWDEYEYDVNGNKTKETRHDSDGSVAAWIEYEYDANGNIIKEQVYDAAGTVYFLYKYEYDANGNETKYTQYNADGSVAGWVEYEYVFR